MVVAKIKGTQKRDKKAEIELNVLGWRVITIWSCELKPKKIEQTLNSLINSLL